MFFLAPPNPQTQEPRETLRRASEATAGSYGDGYHASVIFTLTGYQYASWWHPDVMHMRRAHQVSEAVYEGPRIQRLW